MFSDDDLLPISALQHYVYCPRQCALIHVERIWAENQFTAEGRVLHERTHQEGSQRKKTRHIARGVALRSLKLGLSGQADVVEFAIDEQGGPRRPYVVEYKRGRPKNHQADAVQLCAQAMCIEEMLACDVPAGALFYGQTRRRVEVPFDDLLRQETLEVIAAARGLLESRQTPRATYEKKKCSRCSLRQQCMPEVLDGSESASRYLRRSVADVLNAHGPAGD